MNFSFAQRLSTVNSRFKKDRNLQIHLHKDFFSDDRILDSYQKSFLNQTALDLRKEKWSFLNQEFTVPNFGKTLHIRSEQFSKQNTNPVNQNILPLVSQFFSSVEW